MTNLKKKIEEILEKDIELITRKDIDEEFLKGFLIQKQLDFLSLTKEYALSVLPKKQKLNELANQYQMGEIDGFNKAIKQAKDLIQNE